jgi:hypothetical protein
LPKYLDSKTVLIYRPHPACYTDKKENEVFLTYKKIQMGAVLKSYMTNGLLIYEEMHKYLTICDEAVSHDFATNPF